MVPTEWVKFEISIESIRTHVYMCINTFFCPPRTWTLQTNNPEGSFPDRSVSFLDYSRTKTNHTVSSYQVHFVTCMKCLQKCRKIAGCEVSAVYGSQPLITSKPGSSSLEWPGLDNFASQRWSDPTCPHATAFCTLSCCVRLKHRDKGEVSTIRGSTRAICVRPWLTRDIV